MSADSLGHAEAYEADETDSWGGPPVRLGLLAPGGDPPGPVETRVALILLGALGFIMLARRGFRGVLAR